MLKHFFVGVGLPQIAGDVCRGTKVSRKLQEMVRRGTKVSRKLQEMVCRGTIVSRKLQEMFVGVR